MIKKALLTAVVAASLAGCVASTGTVYHIDDPYQFLTRAANRGNVPVIILGEPYPGQAMAVQAVVLDELERNFRSFGKVFTGVPPSTRLGNGIVVLLNSSDVKARPLADTVCKDPSRPGLTAPQGASYLDVGVIYCVDGPASEAWARRAKPAAPETAEFRSALSRAIYEGLPREIEPSRRLGGMLPPK